MSRRATYNFKDGGAIYISDGILVIHDSTFDANTADAVSEWVMVCSMFLEISLQFPARTTWNFQGGAIHAQRGSVEIHDSAFGSNTAIQVSIQ
jgi:hypothetical protein